MFRKMLVCSDLSPASDALIQCVEELKNIGLEEVILTHVTFLSATPGIEELLTAETSPTLQRQKKYLEERGVRVSVEMPCGLPARAIAETAEQHDVSAILIGSRGKGILQSALLGSVSAHLLHETRRPVLLARISLLEGGTCATVCGGMFAKILFPTDFSETAENVLSFLGKIIRDTGCPVSLMHVLERHGSDQQDAADARFLLDAKMRRLDARETTQVTTELAQGDPAEEIIKRSKKGDVSLIIMGGQGKGIIREAFLGSVASQVARQAETPVLFIPAQADR